MRVEREQEINEEMAIIKEVEYLLEKEDFDGAERLLERVVNHKMEDKLVKVKQIAELRKRKEEGERKKKEDEEKRKQEE